MKPVSKDNFLSDDDQQLHFLAKVCPLPELFGEDNKDSEYRMLWSYEFVTEETEQLTFAHRHEYDVGDFIHNHGEKNDRHDMSCFYAPALFSNADWPLAQAGYYKKRDDKKAVKASAHVRYLKSFWIDIDASPAHSSPASIRQMFNEFADETNMLDANIEWMEVESGGGMHFYLPLIEPVPINEWQPVADALHDFVGTKLGADKITRNSSCLLRLPCSMNRKRNDDGAYKYGAHGKEVVWLTDVSMPNDLNDIRQWLKSQNISVEQPKAGTFKSFVPKKQKSIDDRGLEKMATECNVMATNARNDSPDMHYDVWWNTLALMAKSSDPEANIRAVMPNRTAALEHKRGPNWIKANVKRWNERGYSPPKCREYAKHSPTLCEGCVLHNKKWASPVELAVDPYDDCNDIELAFIERMDDWFKSVGANYNSLFDEDVPLILPRIFKALNKCYMANKDNSLIHIKPRGNQNLIKDNAERISFLQDIRVSGGQFFRHADMFAEHYLIPDGKSKKDYTDIQFERLVGKLHSAVSSAITKSFWDVRNATLVNLSIDMFSDEAAMYMQKRSECKVTLPFLGFPRLPKFPSRIGEDDINAIVDDYRDHFPQFEKFIDFVCHSRFAPTRRFSFLWLVCPSDWGKSFLLKLFGPQGLDIVYDAKTDTIKDMTKGTTSGLTTDGLADKWIMFFDEASGAPKELKDLNDYIVFTPKYGSQTSAPLYAKVFACTNLPTTLTSFGIEDQFRNRCSLIRIPRDATILADRELFVKYGEAYRIVLVHYVRARMEQHVAKMRELGEEVSGDTATEAIAKFKAQYPISVVGTMDETLQEIVENMVLELITIIGKKDNHWPTNDVEPTTVTTEHDGPHPYISYVVKKGTRFVKVSDLHAWVKDHINRTSKGENAVKLVKSVDDMVAMLEKVLEGMGAEYLNVWHTFLDVVDGKRHCREAKRRGHFIELASLPSSASSIDFPWHEPEPLDNGNDDAYNPEAPAPATYIRHQSEQADDAETEKETETNG